MTTQTVDNNRMSLHLQSNLYHFSSPEDETVSIFSEASNAAEQNKLCRTKNSLRDVETNFRQRFNLCI